MPDPNARRRNKRKANTPLPLSGPDGPSPKSPYTLGKAGKKWWKAAWKLPQATAWDDGAIYFIARRAALEDDLAALEDSDALVERVENSMLRILESEDPEDIPERLNYLGLLMGKLKALGTGKLAIVKEMREMDGKLGLNPEAFKRLGWVLEVPEEEADQPKAEGEEGGTEQVRRLRAV